MAVTRRPDMPSELEVRAALSPWAMHAWLQGEGQAAPADVVGYAQSSDRCPVSQYLNAHVGAPRGRGGWWTTRGEVSLGLLIHADGQPGAVLRVPLPDRLVAFVQTVDDLPERERWGGRRRVPRELALRVFNQILEDGRREVDGM